MSERDQRQIAREIVNWLHEVGYIDKQCVNSRRITDRIAATLADREQEARAEVWREIDAILRT